MKDAISWLTVIALLIQCAALVMVVISAISQHKSHRKMQRIYLREGIVMGGLHRVLGLPPSEDILLSQKPSVYERGYMHGYLSTGRRLERERSER